MGGRQVRKREREKKKNYTEGEIEIKRTGSRDGFKFI